MELAQVANTHTPLPLCSFPMRGPLRSPPDEGPVSALPNALAALVADWLAGRRAASGTDTSARSRLAEETAACAPPPLPRPTMPGFDAPPAPPPRLSRRPLPRSPLLASPAPLRRPLPRSPAPLSPTLSPPRPLPRLPSLPPHDDTTSVVTCSRSHFPCQPCSDSCIVCGCHRASPPGACQVRAS
eukprot:365304-Chlamydomonas_euryale.AAC.11